MAVRICTIDVPRFMHDGLDVGPNWTAVDKDLPGPARAALCKFTGRHIRVHPDDVSKLAELGLQQLPTGKLAEIEKKSTTPTKPVATSGEKKER